MRRSVDSLSYLHHVVLFLSSYAIFVLDLKWITWDASARKVVGLHRLRNYVSDSPELPGAAVIKLLAQLFRGLHNIVGVSARARHQRPHVGVRVAWWHHVLWPSS